MNTRHLIKASLVAVMFVAGAAAQANPVDGNNADQNQAASVQPARTFRQAQAASLASVPRGSLMAYSDLEYPAHVPSASTRHLDRATVRAEARHVAPSGEIGETSALKF